MNSNEDFFKGLDPGEGMLPRKRFPQLSLNARVYQEATNLTPPLDPPQPPPMPTETVVAPGPKNCFIGRKYTRKTFPTFGFSKKSNRLSRKKMVIRKKVVDI